MFKKLVVVLLVVGLLALLGTGALAGEKEDADVVTLFPTGTYLVPLLPAIEQGFEQATGYDVYFEMIPPGEMSKVIHLGAAAGSLPDSFQGAVNAQFLMFAEGGFLLPLDDLLLEIGVDLSTFSPEAQSIFDLCRSDGKLYAIPRIPCTGGILHYNKDLFDREGIPYPTADMGWENFKDLARSLVKKDDKGNIIRWGVLNKYVMTNFAYGLGGRIVDDYINPTKVMFGDDAYVNAFQEFLGLAEEGAFMPLSVYRDVFASSKPKIFGEEYTAMIITGMSYGGVFKSLTFDWDITLPPYPEDADSHFPTGVGNHMVSATAKNPRAAASWAYWYAASPEITRIFQSLMEVTTSFVYYTEEQRKILAEFADKRKPANWRVIYEAGKKSLLDSVVINSPEFNDIFWTATWDILYGKRPATYLREAAEEAQKVLDEYNENR